MEAQKFIEKAIELLAINSEEIQVYNRGNKVFLEFSKCDRRTSPANMYRKYKRAFNSFLTNFPESMRKPMNEDSLDDEYSEYENEVGVEVIFTSQNVAEAKEIIEKIES